MKKTILMSIRVVGVILMSLIASASYATVYTGKIQSIGTGPHYDSAICVAETCAVIMVDDSHVGPGCHDGSWDYIIETGTESGRSSLSQLLTAYATGKEIVIGGTSSCALDKTDNIESINYIYFKYK